MFLRNEFPIIDSYFNEIANIHPLSPNRIIHEYSYLLSLSKEHSQYIPTIANHYKVSLDDIKLSQFQKRIMFETNLKTALTTDNQLIMLAIARSNDLEEILMLILNPNCTNKAIDEIYEGKEDRDIRTFCLINKRLSKNHAKDAQRRYGSLYCDMFLAMNEKLYEEVEDLDWALVKAILEARKPQ